MVTRERATAHANANTNASKGEYGTPIPRRKKKGRSKYEWDWRSMYCFRHMSALTLIYTAVLMGLSHMMGYAFMTYTYPDITCVIDNQGTSDTGEILPGGSGSGSRSGSGISDNGTKSEEEEEDELDKIDRIVAARIEAAMKARQEQEQEKKNNESMFPSTMSSFAQGMVRIPQTEFLTKFDYGTPEDFVTRHDITEGVILYNKESALPQSWWDNKKGGVVDKSSMSTSSSTEWKRRMSDTLSVDEATKNCDTMNVIYQNPNQSEGTCLVLVNNYESYHVQKWNKIDRNRDTRSKQKLQIVGREITNQGTHTFPLPSKYSTQRHQGMLRVFMSSEEQMKEELKSILEKIAIQNTILVMTVNDGQVDLLTNFVCAARAKDMDISNLLVVATDTSAYNFVKNTLGIEAFYNEKNFASLSSKEAKFYGDLRFADMMYAKVVSVLLVNSLGYDVLFQDVDIVWYKHPLSLLHDKNFYTDRDIIFQDDGARSGRFGTSFANSGFYYARSNDMTRYLFTSLLYSTDLILQSGSHQQVLAAIMNNYSSMYGLRIKILNKEDFPCGSIFHRKRDYMKRIVKGQFTPYLFHMNWTKNKDDKIKYMEQMGMWYTRINDGNTNSNSDSGSKQSIENLCVPKPLTRCHYKDKPSIIPCKDSPNIDEGGRPFW